jgi:hypothetical protein
MKNDPARINNKKFYHISNMISDIITDYGNNLNKDMLKIWEIWKDTLGEPVANLGKPAGFKNSLLIVNVKSSAAIQQLHFYKKDIIKNLNKTLNKNIVSDIKFKITA